MDLIPVVPIGGNSFAVGQVCIFHNRHSSGLARFDNKACKIINVLPQESWLEDEMPEYRVQFLEDNEPLNNVKVEENELESSPN